MKESKGSFALPEYATGGGIRVVNGLGSAKDGLTSLLHRLDWRTFQVAP